MTLPDIARQANGYILNAAQPRRTVLLHTRDSGFTVAESVTDFTHRRSHPLICLVSFSDGAITHLAEGRRGHAGGTGLRRLNLLNLPPGSFGAVVDAVQKLLPESNRLLECFSESRRNLIARLGREVRTILAYQKETVATTLTLAGIERQELKDWRPASRTVGFSPSLTALPRLTYERPRSSSTIWAPFPDSRPFAGPNIQRPCSRTTVSASRS